MVQYRLEPSFVADMMLGRLTRWMRVLGYDVWYKNPVDDETLLALVREWHRVLITRDTRLVRRRGVGEHMLIRANDPMDQMMEVIRVYPPDPEHVLSRCVRCNIRLVSAEKKDLKDHVPEYIYLTESMFGRCLKCGRVYWRGTHYRHMVSTLTERMKAEKMQERLL